MKILLSVFLWVRPITKCFINIILLEQSYDAGTIITGGETYPEK